MLKDRNEEFVYNPNKYFGYRRRHGEAYNPRKVRAEEKKKREEEKRYGYYR